MLLRTCFTQITPVDPRFAPEMVRQLVVDNLPFTTPGKATRWQLEHGNVSLREVYHETK